MGSPPASPTVLSEPGATETAAGAVCRGRRRADRIICRCGAPRSACCTPTVVSPQLRSHALSHSGNQTRLVESSMGGVTVASVAPTPGWCIVKAEATMAGFEPIKLIKIDIAGLGQPPGDGSRALGTYAVPITLSCPPPSRWRDAFVHAWDNPPTPTSRHRRGIARVTADRVVLDRTTIDEVFDVHAPALKAALRQANDAYAQSLRADSPRRGQRDNAAAPRPRDGETIAEDSSVVND